MPPEQVIDELERRLTRFPPERYPVQHATARFHLGLALADAGRVDEASAALTAAAELFDPERLPAEHAKATNALGAVLRELGQVDAAAEAFRHAAELFGRAELAVERGAALFNLGLVQRERGKGDAAECFAAARDQFDPERHPAQSAAAARELGATLLTSDRLDEAGDVLLGAVRLAQRAGDLPGLGGAANLLGLAHIASGNADAAVGAFREAVAAHPRSVRPGEYAMAKANLALAYEGTGDPDRARLAATQALDTPGAAPPVRAQAWEVLDRVEDEAGSCVLAVLDSEPTDRWVAVLREEVVRWAELPAAELRAEAGRWVDGQLARSGRGSDLAEAWINALLELPPADMEAVLHATVAALGERDEQDADRFRSGAARALAHFPIPQWQRFAQVANEAAEALDQPATWG